MQLGPPSYADTGRIITTPMQNRKTRPFGKKLVNEFP